LGAAFWNFALDGVVSFFLVAFFHRRGVQRGLGGQGFLLVGQLFKVGEAGQDLGQAALALQVLVVFLQQQLDGEREAGQGGLHLVQAFLDALGDGDFAFAGEQFHRTHLAHVHADGIGGAANFGVDRRQQGHGFFGGGFVVAGGTRRGSVGDGVGVRGGVVYFDADALEHRHDVFDLLRIDDVVGEVVVDFSVSQVALFEPLGNELFDFRLLLVGFAIHSDRRYLHD